MIKTRELTKKFGSFTAVDDLTLNVRAGEIYGFLGPNGAGKTTTILMMLGVLKPTSGEIFLFNEEFSPGRLDLKQKVGVVPERHPAGMWKWMTAWEYLEFFADLYRVPGFDERAGYLLERVELREVENKKISEFSRGMIQKLSIARALLHDPDILFLDEPISGLDPMGIKRVRDLILFENRKGRTIFISSHMLSEMEKICHRVAIISKGKLLAEAAMDTLMLKTAKGRDISIELEHIPGSLEEQFKRMDFVLDACRDDNTIIVKVLKKGDYRKTIVQFLIEQNLIPLKMDEKLATLEEAFTIITQDNVEILARNREDA
jgi:ABC-type multidrug transport system ATPase subunit